MSQKYEQLVKINKTEASSLLNAKPFNTNPQTAKNTESDNVFEETVVFDSTSNINKNTYNNTSNMDNNNKDFIVENSEQYQQQLEDNRSLRADLNEKNKVKYQDHQGQFPKNRFPLYISVYISDDKESTAAVE